MIDEIMDLDLIPFLFLLFYGHSDHLKILVITENENQNLC